MALPPGSPANSDGPVDDPARPGDPLLGPDAFADLRPRTRFRLKPGSYAHGVAWCRPGDTYLGEQSHYEGHVVIYAPGPADIPQSVELPAAWFVELEEG